MKQNAQTVERNSIAEFLPVSIGSLYFGLMFFLGAISICGLFSIKMYGYSDAVCVTSIISGCFSAVLVFITPWEVYSGYWRRNVVGYNLVCWNEEAGKQRWTIAKSHDQFPLTALVVSAKNLSGISIPLGGWFKNRKGWVWYRDWQNKVSWVFCYVKELDISNPLQSVVKYTDSQRLSVFLTISQLLTLLEYNSGEAPSLSMTMAGLLEKVAKLREERDDLQQQQQKLATQLQEQTDASREYVNQWQATLTAEKQRHSYSEAVMLDVLFDAIQDIAATQRFGKSKEGRKIRQWLKEEFLELASPDDKRREVFKSKKSAA